MFKNFFPQTARWGRALLALGLLAGPLAALAQPTGYCDTGLGGGCGGNNVTDVAIAATTLSNPNIVCNTTAAFDAYTIWPASGNTTATLSPGVSYQVTVTTDGISIISVWGDWNLNGLFEASEWTQVAVVSGANAPTTVTVPVPATALAGLTRFRVRSRNQGNPNGDIDACTLFGSGETEDYVITIGPPPACAPPINLGVSNVTTTAATLTFSGASNGTAVGYVVQYGIQGFVPGGAGSNTVNTTNTSVPLTGLTNSTNYEFYVTKNCGGGMSSIRNGPFRFRTACVAPVYATLPVLVDFENAWVNACGTRDVPSSSWLNTPITGNLSWRRDDDGAAANWTNPTFGAFTVNGAQGRHAARFHDYSASTNAGLTGTLDLYVDLSGTGAKVLQFDYINPTGTDSLLVQFSTDGGNTFGRPLLRRGVGAAFGQQSVSLPATTSATCVVRFRAVTDFFGSTDIGLDNVRLAALVGVPGCVTNAVPANGATSILRPVTLTWQPTTGVATGYDVSFGTSATTLALVSSNQPGTSYTVTASLAGNTIYYYQVVPRNSNGPATGCSVLSFTTSNVLTYCTTGLGGVCGTADITDVVIAGTTLNNPNTVCNTSPGGDVYTSWPASGSTTATLTPGNAYQVSVTTNGTGIISVWGDWNQNGQLEVSEWTQIATASTTGQPATMTVNVPANALSGQTLLRVRSRSSGNPNAAPDACSPFGSGETEDYVVDLGPPPACAPPVNLAIANLAPTAATFSFSGNTNGAATGYVVQYGVTGFVPGGTGSTTVNTTATTVPLPALTPGTTYQVYVTKSCGPGMSSTANGPFTFTTPIVNDEPCTATALPINNTCQPTNGTLISATATPNTVFAGGNGGTGCGFNTGGPPDVWYQFTTAATGPASTAVRISVTGNAASVVRAYRGAACAGPLTFLSCAGTASATAAPNLDLTSLTPGTTYYVRVHTYNSFDQPGAFTICATPVPNCPAPAALTAGTLTSTTAQLSWAGAPAAGSTFTVFYGPTGFVPGSGGTSVTGIAGTSTTLTGLAPTTTYQVYVQQICGGFNGSSTLVGPISLTTPITIPSNDEPCGATPLTGATALTSTNLGATTSLLPGINLPACAPSQAPKDVWFTFTTTGNSISLTVAGPAAGMVRLFTLTNCTTGPLVPVGCRAAAAANTGFAAPLLFTGLTPGQQYYIAVSGFGSADPGGTFSLTATSVLATRPAAAATALLVHPNPSADGHLTLRLPSGAAAQATLVNALGQAVRGWTLAAGGQAQAVSTQGLAAGVYTLRVQANGEWLTRKVVLE